VVTKPGSTIGGDREPVSRSQLGITVDLQVDDGNVALATC
jgi:hypothetical protein